MLPEAAKAIEIADRHLPGAPPEQRLALAKDIVEAIDKHARQIAHEAIRDTAARPPWATIGIDS